MNELDNWSLSQVWNDLITEERKPEKRSFIRASEIGGPFLDRYLRMKGVPITNPFDARILRVFDSGHVFEEKVVTRIFRDLGILIKNQGELKLEKKGLLPVIGHHDPMVGGNINLTKVKQMLSNTWATKLQKKFKKGSIEWNKLEDAKTPEWEANRTLRLAQALKKAYPKGLRPLVTEIKTVNSRAFWAKKNQDPKTGFFKGYAHHKLQLWTYLNAGNYPEGRFFYISKDDLTLMEASLYKDDKDIEAKWNDDISKMTHYYKHNIEPGAEPNIIYNDEKQKFEPNWRIRGSAYFTYITGYDNEDDWIKSFYPKLKELNSGYCKVCKKKLQRDTLLKYDGMCGKCNTAKNKKTAVIDKSSLI